jgi:hypothetical protein
LTFGLSSRASRSRPAICPARVTPGLLYLLFFLGKSFFLVSRLKS